jgi:hypothetical protein
VTGLALFSSAFLLRGFLLPQEVGYRGPIPSVAARKALEPLYGRALPAGSVGFHSKELVVKSFLVTPFAPSVIVEDPTLATQPPDALPRPNSGRFWIPVLTDGDIADLLRRAGLTPPPGIDGEKSSEYERFLAGG